jgi:hypothetical protein
MTEMGVGCHSVGKQLKVYCSLQFVGKQRILISQFKDFL